MPEGMMTVNIESLVDVAPGPGAMTFGPCDVESREVVNMSGTLLDEDSVEIVVFAGVQLEMEVTLMRPSKTTDVTT